MGAINSHHRFPQLPPPPPPPPSESSPASLPENVLAEIFLKLPPQPAHLRNVALGSHQFCDVVTNHPFLRRFHAHHGDVPPLVGFFLDEKMQIPRFLPTGSKSAGSGGALELWDDGWAIVSTRHGRLLLRSPDRQRLLVLDPMAGRRKYIDAPSRCLTMYRSTAALVCDPSATAGHGDCRSSAFRVVFVYFSHLFRTVMYIYSSETEQWVKVDFQDVAPISAIDVKRPCVQVGDVIYWPGVFAWFLAFNVNTHQLCEIPIPLELRVERFNAGFNYTVVAAKDGSSLGFVHVNEHNNLQLWVSNFFNGAHVEWIPLRTVRLDNILPLGCARKPEEFRIVGYDEDGNSIVLPLGGATTREPEVKIVGYDEDENVLYLWTEVSVSEDNVFGLQLDTMQSNKLLENSGWMCRVHPYKSFFITADGSSGSDDLGHCQN